MSFIYIYILFPILVRVGYPRILIVVPCAAPAVLVHPSYIRSSVSVNSEFQILLACAYLCEFRELETHATFDGGHFLTLSSLHAMLFSYTCPPLSYPNVKSHLKPSFFFFLSFFMLSPNENQKWGE